MVQHYHFRNEKVLRPDNFEGGAYKGQSQRLLVN
jgi:hypothetical protein